MVVLLLPAALFFKISRVAGTDNTKSVRKEGSKTPQNRKTLKSRLFSSDKAFGPKSVLQKNKNVSLFSSDWLTSSQSVCSIVRRRSLERYDTIPGPICSISNGFHAVPGVPLQQEFYWRSTQDTDRDRYSLKDQSPKIKVSNDLIWLSELVSRLVVYTPIILFNPSAFRYPTFFNTPP